MFEGQPRGLWALALANTGERFGYYTMLAVFTLFLQANFHFDEKLTSTIFSSFLMLVYFLPLFGGMLADKFGYSKMVTIGIFVMFVGYVLLALPLGANTLAIIVMAASLLFVSLGTGLFKGNLQVMVGDLYNDPRYADKRDSGFSLFYMAINIGAMFAPTAAIEIMKWSQETFGVSEADSYHYAFAVACASLIFSIAIYYLGMGTFRQVITTTKKKDAAATNEPQAEELSPTETRERITCLILVMAVVVFFWMAFHQNGLTLTFFARDYTATSSSGVQAMMFDVTNLVAAIFMVFGAFALFQSKEAKGKLSGAALILAPAAYLYWNYQQLPESISISAPIFQQFNACFVVMLTPVSIALFGWLGKKGKEPKAPVKIGLGMLVAALGFIWMAVGSMGLELPLTQFVAETEGPRVSANLLISTYLILTFAELLLSPIGISFVTKVTPPKYAGLMMGLWFGATAVGNQLVMVPGLMWGANFNLVTIWGVLAGICLVSAIFIFSIIKKLNKVA